VRGGLRAGVRRFPVPDLRRLHRRSAHQLRGVRRTGRAAAWTPRRPGAP